jgi:F5/8 type C domain-containing protein
MIASLVAFATILAQRPGQTRPGQGEVLLFTHFSQVGKAVRDYLTGYPVEVTADEAEAKEGQSVPNASPRRLAHIAWRGTIVFDPAEFGSSPVLTQIRRNGGFLSRDIPNFESELVRVVSEFRDFYPRATIYVVARSAEPHDDASARDLIATYFAPLTRQAARETGVKIIEMGTASSFEEAVGDAITDQSSEKKTWKLVSTDSEESEEGPARNAIDGDLTTYWHTRYSPRPDRYPHEIVVDMGSDQSIGGFRYVPRQDGGVNGRVKAYAFFVSEDGKTWGDAVSTGDLPNSPQPSRVKFAAAANARFFRFVAKSEQNGGPWASAAEIDILRAKP